LVVALTGATGAVLGVRLLEALRELSVESHVILSEWSKATLNLEMGYGVSNIENISDTIYSANDQAAAISSGSFHTDGMVIVPCSMKTLAAVRVGYGNGLIARAADVTIKERRPLVLVPRESPLSEIHLENMLALARMGVTIIPPMPAFYNKPRSVDDIVDHIVVRILDQLGLDWPRAVRWGMTDL
jgi:4-hydroxy-3-polyprenylbenzoate decarboxylase